MTPNLYSYLTTKFDLKQDLALELVNRLDNICSLSGQPMSPDLHAFLEKKFGLEMVRVMQDYSSFSANVLSPELTAKINRVFNNTDLALEVAGIFSQSCIPAETPCWWFYTIMPAYISLCSSFADYTINGQNWYINAQTIFNGLGINYYYWPFYNTTGTFADIAFISYFGTQNSIPGFIALDCNGQPFVSWVKLSDAGGNCKDLYCYEATLKAGSSANVGLLSPFFGYYDNIDFVTPYPGVGIDLMTTFGQNLFKDVFVNSFGGSADVTFTQTLTEVTVTIINIWSPNKPLAIDLYGNPTAFDQCP